MSMMFSLLMDLPLRLFRPWFLVYSRMQLMTMMLILSIPILKGVISSEITPQVLRHVWSFLSSNFDSSVSDLFELDSGSQFWLKMIEAIKDPYAVERLSEQLLHYLAIEHASDVEAYWFFWLLFHQTFKTQTLVRSVSMLCS